MKPIDYNLIAAYKKSHQYQSEVWISGIAPLPAFDL